MAPKVSPPVLSNARQAQRRAAIRQLNAIAGELGLELIPVKCDCARVEGLVRELDRVCPDASTAARVRAASATFVHHGGTLSVQLQKEQADTDADDMPLMLVQRHRVLEEGLGEPTFRVRAQPAAVERAGKQTQSVPLRTSAPKSNRKQYFAPV